MSKQLKLFNGRGVTGRGDHFYCAAFSVADAARVLNLAENKLCKCGPRSPEANKRCEGRWNREINVYFSKGCWGDPMEGITPERGVWYQTDRNKKPERIV